MHLLQQLSDWVLKLQRIVHSCVVDAAIQSPMGAVGARPKKRAVPPASLLPGPFQVRFVQSGRYGKIDPVDERKPNLDMMLEVVLASGRHRLLFGVDLVRMPLEGRPASSHAGPPTSLPVPRPRAKVLAVAVSVPFPPKGPPLPPVAGVDGKCSSNI